MLLTENERKFLFWQTHREIISVENENTKIEKAIKNISDTDKAYWLAENEKMLKMNKKTLEELYALLWKLDKEKGKEV